ncbi:MAG: hypothetical protein ACI9WS_002434 [Paraglaciecola psychrophila]|jgi:hypothetical protein
MARALLNLNDLKLSWQSDSGVEAHTETEAVGVAYHHGETLECGARGWSSLWLEPQHCYSQYWQRFNQHALQPQRPGVRHHGDLVFHQLQQLQQQHGSTLADSGSAADTELIICPPSHFRESELALLLAVAQSLQLPVVNFVDSAVAAAAAVDSGARERLLYIDMQLHQTQLVELVALDGLWRRGAVTPLGDCGLLALLNTAAHFLADRFIDQHRFDPLKLAANAQYLYALIATSLLHHSADFTVELDTSEGRLSFTIDAASWQQMLARRLHSLLHSVQQQLGQGAICLHHNSEWLQGLFSSSTPQHRASDRQIAEHLFQHWPALATSGPVFIDALGRLSSKAAVAAAHSAPHRADQPATHIVFDNIAYALAEGLWFSGGEQDLHIHQQAPNEPLASMTLEGATVHLSWQPGYALSRGLAAEQAVAASVGATINIQRRQLTLIALADPSLATAVCVAADNS